MLFFRKPSKKRVILVTPTYERPQRMPFINRLIDIFKRWDNILWIVIEEGSVIYEDVRNALEKSGISYVYLNIPENRPLKKGDAQRNLALHYIRDNKLKGIVYFADDDNYYDRQLINEIRKTKKISIFPVGNLGPHYVERPYVRNNRIVGWDAGWTERKYPVDMAGFAVNADVFQALEEPLWPGPPPGIRGGEMEFIEKIIRSKDEFEILCDGCRKCYAWHNEPLRKTHLSTRFILFTKQCGIYYFIRSIKRKIIKSKQGVGP